MLTKSTGALTPWPARMATCLLRVVRVNALTPAHSLASGDATHTHLRIFAILIVGIAISLGAASRRHMVALVRAIIPMMTESYIDGLQSPAVALVRSPLKRLVVSAIIIFTLAGMAGCFAYFVVGPAPVSQSAALLRLRQRRLGRRPRDRRWQQIRQPLLIDCDRPMKT